MYNRIEKLRQFGLLKGKSHAESDLELLRQEYPTCPKLKRYARDPKRYADAILYDLLDVCEADVIADYREYMEGEEETSSKTLTDENVDKVNGSINKEVVEDGSSEETKNEPAEQLKADSGDDTGDEKALESDSPAEAQPEEAPSAEEFSPAEESSPTEAQPEEAPSAEEFSPAEESSPTEAQPEEAPPAEEAKKK